MRLTRATRHALHQVVVAGTLSNACNAVDSGRRDKRFSGLHSAICRRSRSCAGRPEETDCRHSNASRRLTALTGKGRLAFELP